MNYELSIVNCQNNLYHGVVAPIFLEITIIICLAAILAVIFRFLKQPNILAYILTGVIIGPLGFLSIQNHDFIQTLAELGITFLLFMLGLEIKLKDLSSIGKVAVIISFSQIFFSFLFGYILSLLFGFSIISAAYIGICLSFSSTVIVVKLISDKKEVHSLAAKIAIGVLLIEDFLAILVLLFLSGFNPNGPIAISLPKIREITIKGVLIFGLVGYLSSNVFPKLIEKIAKSTETLFLISIAWLFGLSAFVNYIGFSVQIGGFLAGLSLANSIANYQIIARAKILRDFFIVIFFVLLGAQMTFSRVSAVFFPALIMSALILLGKPFIDMLLMGMLGFKKRTAFLTGINLAQISEFSLIIVFLGQRLSHISTDVVSLITLVGVITFTLSTYMIIGAGGLYRFLNRYLGFLEHKSKEGSILHMIEDDGIPQLSDHVVVIGGDQMGQSIISALEDIDMDVVLVDFDPEIFKKFENLPIRKTGNKAHKLFGDIADLDIVERAQLSSAKLVISTIPDLEDNLFIIKELKRENRKAKVVVMALDISEARVLYKEGADYVILPHLAGGRQVAKLIEENNLDKIETLKNKDMKFLDLTV